MALPCGTPALGPHIPGLDHTMTYTQVSAGHFYTVLLRSDGEAEAYGVNTFGQCDIPRLPAGMTYKRVSAGMYHTVLLRSDGNAVACGESDHKQCDIPALDPGTWYAGDVSFDRNLVLQLDCSGQADAMLLTLSSLTGAEMMRLNASPSDHAWNTHKRIAHQLKVPLQSLRVVLPDGQLLAAACRANPGASLEDVIESRKRRRLTHLGSEQTKLDCKSRGPRGRAPLDRQVGLVLPREP